MIEQSQALAREPEKNPWADLYSVGLVEDHSALCWQKTDAAPADSDVLQQRDSDTSVYYC